MKNLGHDSGRDIEESLRNPESEYAYVDEYFKEVFGRALPVITEALKDTPDSDELLEEIKDLFEKQDGSVIVPGAVVKQLSEAGLLRTTRVVARDYPDTGEGYIQKARMSKWEESRGEEEIWGSVEGYKLQLPQEEGDAPVTVSLTVTLEQEVIPGETNRYGGEVWGPQNPDRWTISWDRLN